MGTVNVTPNAHALAFGSFVAFSCGSAEKAPSDPMRRIPTSASYDTALTSWGESTL